MALLNNTHNREGDNPPADNGPFYVSVLFLVLEVV